ncbi:hypothetical protein [Candidatus Blastococcus massiliensis]|uniref:hypothetical protein n=1 Tax=Candidatus Blastococcus massiliensis TaxID=1470358 RepID=UPI0012DF5416|nr:hypothetical protein [Candidatus Blastococcus massiliensis]
METLVAPGRTPAGEGLAEPARHVGPGILAATWFVASRIAEQFAQHALRHLEELTRIGPIVRHRSPPVVRT